MPLCYDDPENIEARENMAYAEDMAGLAYSNSGLGIAHSIAHALSGKYNIQHGIALSMVLPKVLKYNMYGPTASEYKYIAEAFNINTAGMKIEEICRAAVKEMENFIRSYENFLIKNQLYWYKDNYYKNEAKLQDFKRNYKTLI